MATAKTQLKEPKPKLTPEQRREQRQEKERQARLEKAAAQAAFEEQRAAIWARLFTKALRIEIIKKAYTDADGNMTIEPWWFEDFTVDARNPSFTLYYTSANITEQSLTVENVMTYENQLDEALGYFDAEDARREQARQEALEHERKVQKALAKLDPEDIAVLNLRR